MTSGFGVEWNCELGARTSGECKTVGGPTLATPQTRYPERCFHYWIPTNQSQNQIRHLKCLVEISKKRERESESNPSGSKPEAAGCQSDNQGLKPLPTSLNILGPWGTFPSLLLNRGRGRLVSFCWLWHRPQRCLWLAWKVRGGVDCDNNTFPSFVWPPSPLSMNTLASTIRHGDIKAASWSLAAGSWVLRPVCVT